MPETALGQIYFLNSMQSLSAQEPFQHLNVGMNMVRSKWCRRYKRQGSTQTLYLEIARWHKEQIWNEMLADVGLRGPGWEMFKHTCNYIFNMIFFKKTVVNCMHSNVYPYIHLILSFALISLGRKLVFYSMQSVQ